MTNLAIAAQIYTVDAVEAIGLLRRAGVMAAAPHLHDDVAEAREVSAPGRIA